MNILLTAGVCAVALALLWALQSVALLIAGESLTWPLRYTTERPLVRWTGRLMIQVSWLVILLGVPLALGISLPQALHRMLPLPLPWRNITIGVLVVVLPCLAALALYAATGWLRIVPRFDAAARRAKLFRRFLTPLPLATVEEAVFRGTILEQLLQVMPQTLPYAVAAVLVSAVVFSSVHFIRRQPSNKPVWQQAYGFFLAGCVFGAAYIVGGRNLWVPIAMHASAIFLIEVGRLYCQFIGPRWIIGFAESPYSGVVGTATIAAMTIVLVVLI